MIFIKRFSIMWPICLLHTIIEIKASYALGHSVKSTDFWELFWVQSRKEWDQEFQALLGNYVTIPHSVMETGRSPSPVTERLWPNDRQRGEDPQSQQFIRHHPSFLTMLMAYILNERFWTLRNPSLHLCSPLREWLPVFWDQRRGSSKSEWSISQ